VRNNTYRRGPVPVTDDRSSHGGAGAHFALDPGAWVRTIAIGTYERLERHGIPPAYTAVTEPSRAVFVALRYASQDGKDAKIRMQPTVLRVKVKPHARVSTLEQDESGSWLAKVKAAPIDGQANEELIGLIAKHFRCPKSAVSIRHGASGRIKLVQINAY